ncbi:MAG: META domain-containing protein [Oleispira sp.]|nr:META domain-containing protein [Oleispira sp.]MBL4881151.1 META domain-containing protein [Oleispira sp.]
MSKYALLILCVLFLSACGSSSSDRDPEVNGPVLNLSLQDTRWSLISYGYQMDDKTSVLANSSYYLVFDDTSKVDGDIECNHFSSTYEAGASTLTFGLVAITEMACPNTGVAEYDAQDMTIVNALSAAQSYRVSADELIIIASDSTHLVFERIE